MMRKGDVKHVDCERPSQSTDAMCQRVLPSRPTSCLSWRESSYRVGMKRGRDLLPQGSGKLLLVAAENLLHQSHRVVCGWWTREVFLHDCVCLVRGDEVVFRFCLKRHAPVLIPSPNERDILQLVRHQIGVEWRLLQRNAAYAQRPSRGSDATVPCC